MPPAYGRTGFNDRFDLYVASSGALAFDKVSYMRGHTIRFFVSWSDTTNPSPGMVNLSGYNQLLSQALSHGLKVLPMVIGCPSWLPRATGGVTPYPTTTAGWQAYGDFVLAVATYFNQRAPMEAVELWNEPNYFGTPTAPGFSPVPATPHYREMFAQAGSKMFNANEAGTFGAGHRITVLCGGLAFADNWRQYYHDFSDNVCVQFEVSFHFYGPWPMNVGNAVEAHLLTINQIVDQYNKVQAETQRPIWVTETGCQSTHPYNSESWQSQTIRAIHNDLRYRSSCRAMLLHRLYPNDEDPGEAEAPNTAFHGYSVVRGDWSSKQVVNDLRDSIWL